MLSKISSGKASFLMVFPYIFVGIAQISGCFLWRGKSVDFEGFAANKVPIKSVKQAFFEPKMGQNSKSSTILFSRTFYHILIYSTTVSYKTATTTCASEKNRKNPMYINIIEQFFTKK